MVDVQEIEFEVRPEFQWVDCSSDCIIGWNYILEMQASDYVEIYWSVPNTAVTIQHLAASGTPTKPSTQSVVATMSFVSALST